MAVLGLSSAGSILVAGCDLGCLQAACDRDGLTVSALLDQLYQKYPGLQEWDAKILVALDLDYVERDAIAVAGQELAVMPPVQGG